MQWNIGYIIVSIPLNLIHKKYVFIPRTKPNLVVNVVFVDVVFVDDELNKTADGVNVNRFEFSRLELSLGVIRQRDIPGKIKQKS